MIKSMTGFGKAEATLPHKKITVEIRSLNSRQLDLSVRMPAAYRQAEFELRGLVSKAVERGKVDLLVAVETTAAETAAVINDAALEAHFRHLNGVCRQMGVAASEQVDAALLTSILRLPDVVATDAGVLSREEHAALMQAAQEAVTRLDAFRTQEGATLIADLLRRVDRIETLKDEVTPFEKARTETIRARILENLAKLPVQADENRLEQEMIFYLEKLDITEEKVRLANHCRYFREVAETEQAAGRKLGFIAQEMGREINTMGSKANESNIQILVVRMKDELEKIKEQVLNLL